MTSRIETALEAIGLSDEYLDEFKGKDIGDSSVAVYIKFPPMLKNLEAVIPVSEHLKLFTDAFLNPEKYTMVTIDSKEVTGSNEEQENKEDDGTNKTEKENKTNKIDDSEKVSATTSDKDTTEDNINERSMASPSSDSEENPTSEISTEPLIDINILLLGETGVGKSTWINGIANYLTYDSLEEAINNEVVVLIPSQFTMTNDNYEEITVPIGPKDPNEVHVTGQSATQYPHTYSFKTDQFNISIIDTPGIGDTRGIDQDKENFQYIMNHLSSLDVIHGICILLKPNTARLGVAFKFCIQELLTQLHRDAAQNITFCFTNARSTFYRPGDTLSSLRVLLTDKKALSTHIPLEKKTIYCLDNEAFRFLAAVKAGQNFEETEQANFSKSWETSVKETARLVNYIQELKPHRTTNTVTLNATRQTIIKLAKPLADVSQNIQTNIALIEDKQKELESLDSTKKGLRGKLTLKQTDLEREELEFPRTVCTDPSCTQKLSIYTTTGQQEIFKINYIQICHDHCFLELGKNELNCVGLMDCAAMSNGKCKYCKHGYEKHMHITYSTKQVLKEFIDINVQTQLDTTEGRIQATKAAISQFEQLKNNLQSEQKVINKTTAKYAVFLKENSITPYNNAIINYMDYLIKLEEAKVNQGGEQSMLDKLQKLRDVYKQEEQILLDSLVNNSQEGQVSLDDIQKSFEDLFNLAINGPTIRGFLDTANTADKMCYRERVCEAPARKQKGRNSSYGLGGLIVNGISSATNAVTTAIKKLGR